MVVVYVAALISGVLLCLGALVLFFIGTQSFQAGETGGIFTALWARFVLLGAGLSALAWGGNGLRRSRHARATQKTKTADEELRVYESTDSHSPLVAKLPEGTDIELGPVTEANGVDWVSVKLPDGKQGYVLGNAHVHTMLKAVIEKEAPVYEFADLASPPVSQLPVGTELEIVKGDWDSAFDQIVMVRAWAGERKIHIKSNTKVRWT
jgi:hypothetical protein